MTSEDIKIALLKSELEMAQKSLKFQTRRCRELVEEYTKRLQEKERQYQSERVLRDNQLAKVIRALLMFEARLRQEQKLIRHQLEEKDFIITKQKGDMQRLLNNQYCKHCNQFYNLSSNLESFNSSSEYLGTDYNEYQSSNVESLDSSCETYATVSDKDYDFKSRETESGDEVTKNETGKFFTKNKNSFNRRGKKIGHRKSVGTYFEVLKLRNDGNSLDDDTSTSKLDSLSSDDITILNENNYESSKEEVPEYLNSSSNMSESDCNDTVIQKINDINEIEITNKLNEAEHYQVNDATEKEKTQKITESIPVFDGDGETNDNWYVSAASDQEDEEQNRIYRNNPVLECMNQILLQNMNGVNSPPKTPNMERRVLKGKKVKFRDEENTNAKYENQTENTNNPEPENELVNSEQNYYETPVQKVPNFYETPQSIYGNDYEQIMSNCNEPINISFNQQKLKIPNETATKHPDNEYLSPSKVHDYIDMDTNLENDDTEKKIVRKTKILRVPPALPPKPANLLSKYKLHALNKKKGKDETSIDGSIESEPDYCSISELNLPNKGVVLNKINVVSETNANNINEIHKIDKSIILHKPKVDEETYDPIDINECITNLVKKNVEKFNVQLAKQTTIKSENVLDTASMNKPLKQRKDTVDIPKLPQVSEIIIPDDCESKKDERITQDNYVKNNTQVLKTKSILNETTRKSIKMGSSVSSIITGFNNKQLLSEIKNKPDKLKDNKMFSSFENLQNFDKHTSPVKLKKSSENCTFENFDLSQNFEEFKLDDCEIGEEYKLDLPDLVTEIKDDVNESDQNKPPSSNAEALKATTDPVPSLNSKSVELLKRRIEMQINPESLKKRNLQHSIEPTYEHFLECTGLSSKSILGSSRFIKNQKSNIKSKDSAIHAKLKLNNVHEKQGNSIKYWSEPFI